MLRLQLIMHHFADVENESSMFVGFEVVVVEVENDPVTVVDNTATVCCRC